jgi:hypothetical protein
MDLAQPDALDRERHGPPRHSRSSLNRFRSQRVLKCEYVCI